MELNSSNTDLPFEAASILRLIRGFIGCQNSGHFDLPSPEAAGMLLWDMAADSDAAAGAQHQLARDFAALSAVLVKGQQWQSLEPAGLHHMAGFAAAPETASPV
jgi:hypothetical protein